MCFRGRLRNVLWVTNKEFYLFSLLYYYYFYFFEIYNVNFEGIRNSQVLQQENRLPGRVVTLLLNRSRHLRGNREEGWRSGRALASHQCGPGSIPELSVICGLILLLVLVLAPRGLSPATPVFPSPETNKNSKFQFDLASVPN